MSGHGFTDAARELVDWFSVLVLGGVAGGAVRALALPEHSWKRRVTYIAIGALCALFVGGLVAVLTIQMFKIEGTTATIVTLSASSFMLGLGGEVLVTALTNKIFGRNGAK